ncbi:hypothetical protein [Gordonia sp. NPDC003422]
MDRVSAARDVGIPLVTQQSSPEGEIRTQVDELLHHYHLDDATQWSRYEPPGIAWGLANVCGRIEETIAGSRPESSWTLGSLPVVGTLATAQPGVQVQVAPDDEVPPIDHPVIAIENGAFTLASQLAQVGVLCLVADDPMRAFGASNSAAAQIVCDIAALQAIGNTSLDGSARAVSAAHHDVTLIDAIRDAILTFILSHEYGHLLHGDLESHRIGSDGSEDPAAEYDADAIGAQITRRVMGGSTKLPMAAVLGPVLFFAGVDIRRRVNELFEPSVVGADPPAEDRKNRIIESFRSDEQLLSYADQADSVYQQVMALWDRVEPVVRSKHEQLQRFRTMYDDENSDRFVLRIFAMRELWACYTQAPV